MANIVKFEFLLLAVGEILKINREVSAQDVQDYIANDPEFSVRPPLDECRLALNLMENSGFIFKSSDNGYERVITRSDV